MRLNEFIQPNAHFARSVNLDRDFDDAEFLAGYVPVRRAVESFQRFTEAMREGYSDRAWSITGPYGSGKSSFAHFLCSAVAHSDSIAFKQSMKALRKVDPTAAATFVKARKALESHDRGFIRAVTAARREPIIAIVLRALEQGVDAFWNGPGRRPKVVERLSSLRRRRSLPTAAEVIAVVDELAQHAPIVLVLDEMGKALEYAASTKEADLYLLQLLAERAASPTASPLFLLTLQHQSFDEYLFNVSAARKREWTKVQGRFEDIPFVEGLDQAFQLMSSALQRDKAPRGFGPLVEKWSAESVGALKALVDDASVVPSRAVIDACYPLHPLLLPILPELCARYGQHDRTLFSFLTNPTPGSLPAFLHQAPFDKEDPSFVGLDMVFDYFVEAMASGPSSGADPGRWLEIQSRVREAVGLDDGAQKCLKAVAILNLVSDRAAGKASRSTVEFAVAGPLATAKRLREVRATLAALETDGFITYVDFADEFRIWQGSDFDVRAAVDGARERLAHASLLDQLHQAHPLRPVVARRHSQRTGTLRYFEARYATWEEATSAPSLSDATADGLVLYLVDAPPDDLSVAASTKDEKPLVVVASDGTSDLRQAALDSAAVLTVLDSEPSLARDAVARQEVRRRVVLTQDILRNRLADAYSPDKRSVTWWASGKLVRPQGSSALSTLLSDLCDSAYSRTPRVHNEMLNRRILTSQGAKTRRELIEAMLSTPYEPDLGITGHGPDWAMYKSVLERSKLHRHDKGFAAPTSGSGLLEVWQTIQDFFDSAVDHRRSLGDLYFELMAPPIGMKDGPIPVLLIAALIVRRDDVSIYQDGTFLPALTADVVERLVKAPERFEVKTFQLAGIRRTVFRELERLLETEAGEVTRDQKRNSTLLSVVKPLIAFVRSLPAYTRGTRRLSVNAKAVRDALLSATEPDELLFAILPEACGLEAFKARQRDRSEKVEEFSRRLAAAVDELRQCYSALLDSLRIRLAEEFGTAGDPENVREDLRNRSLHLVDGVIDRKLKSLLMSVVNKDFDDKDWLEALSMVIVGRPPEAWSDDDVTRFELETLELSRRFARVEGLYWDMRVQSSSSPAEARRVTVTHPDGGEVSEVLWVDKEAAEALSGVVAEALKRAEDVGGPMAKKALLSMLLSDLLPRADSGVIEDQSEFANEKGVSHGT